MNYEEMSDFEINKAVTCAVFGCQGWDFSDNNAFYNCGIDGWGCHEQTVLDYCHEESISMPIIKACRILMHYDCESGVWEAASLSPQYRRNDSEKPLRSAMIVFLMMQEASQ